MGTSRWAGSWGKGQHVVLWPDRSTATCGWDAPEGMGGHRRTKKAPRPAGRGARDGCLPAVAQEGRDVEVLAVEGRRRRTGLPLPGRGRGVGRRLITSVEGIQLAHALGAKAGGDHCDLHLALQAI